MHRIGQKALLILLISSSPLMADVKIFDGDLRIAKEESNLGALSLVCPKSQDDKLTLLSGNRKRLRNRYSLIFINGVSTIVLSEISRNSAPFEEIEEYDVRDLQSADLENALELMKLGNTLLNEICNGSSEAKQRFRELLHSNLSILGLSPEDYPSNF